MLLPRADGARPSGKHSRFDGVNAMKITALHPQFKFDMLGLVPSFLNESDPRPAREQFDTGYTHGGGWQPMSGWKLDLATAAITYPGDPALHPLACIHFRNERIYFYRHSWFCIVQPDGTFEIAGMD